VLKQEAVVCTTVDMTRRLPSVSAVNALGNAAAAASQLLQHSSELQRWYPKRRPASPLPPLLPSPSPCFVVLNETTARSCRLRWVRWNGRKDLKKVEWKKCDSITSTLRDVLHWLPIRQRVDYKLGVLMFNCLHDLAPGYLTTMCHAVSENPGRHNLCSAARQDLLVSPTRTVRYGPHSFAAAGPSTWNYLPTSLRNQQLSVTSFCRHLKTELYCRAYNRPLAHLWLFMTLRVGEQWLKHIT